MTLMFRRAVVAMLLLMGAGLPSAVRAQGSPQASGAVTLFENVRIFDGKSATLSPPPTFWCAVTRLRQSRLSPSRSIAERTPVSSMAAVAR